MANVKIAPQDLREKSKEYTSSAEDIQNIIKRLDSLNSYLEENWEGDAFEGYLSQYSQLRPTVENFEKIMNDVSEQLKSVASKFEEFDLDVKNSFGIN